MSVTPAGKQFSHVKFLVDADGGAVTDMAAIVATAKVPLCAGGGLPNGASGAAGSRRRGIPTNVLLGAGGVASVDAELDRGLRLVPGVGRDDAWPISADKGCVLFLFAWESLGRGGSSRGTTAFAPISSSLTLLVGCGGEVLPQVLQCLAQSRAVCLDMGW